MNIKFQRTGGFAGIATNVEVDSATLAEERSTTLRDLLGKILPLKQPEKGEVIGADLCNYKLTVTDGDQEQVLEVDDANASDDMYAVFDFLMQESGNKKA